jgi:hypothetical protein
MTLEETLLQKLAEARPEEAGRHPLQLGDESGGVVVYLDIERRDLFSCLLWEVRVSRRAPLDDLSSQAKRLTERITGLLEPLQVDEIDSASGVARLRSEAPLSKGDQRIYYELTLRGSTAELRRWQGSMTSARRQAVAFVLTNEALAKLVGDLAS